MKNYPHFKFLGSALIGVVAVLATTGATQAVDIGAPVLIWHARPAITQPPVRTAAETALSGQKDRGLAPRGAQGPIRTEDFSDRATKLDRDMVRQDLLMERYPMSNGVSIP